MRSILGESCPCLRSELEFGSCRYRIIALRRSGVPVEEVRGIACVSRTPTQYGGVNSRTSPFRTI
eukprot:5212128-Ditylum_brightwellii.AAC.1